MIVYIIISVFILYTIVTYVSLCRPRILKSRLRFVATTLELINLRKSLDYKVKDWKVKDKYYVVATITTKLGDMNFKFNCKQKRIEIEVTKESDPNYASSTSCFKSNLMGWIDFFSSCREL